MIQCGTPIDESEVPDDHPIRQRPLPAPIIPVISTPKKVIERPTIKEYEEDIDLELDLNGSKAKRVKLPPSRSPSPISSTSPLSSSSPLSSPSPSLSSTLADHSTPANKDTLETTQNIFKSIDTINSQNSKYKNDKLKRKEIDLKTVNESENKSMSDDFNNQNDLQTAASSLHENPTTRISLTTAPATNILSTSTLNLPSLSSIPSISTTGSPLIDNTASFSTTSINTGTESKNTTLISNSQLLSLSHTPLLSSPIVKTTDEMTITSDKVNNINDVYNALNNNNNNNNIINKNINDSNDDKNINDYGSNNSNDTNNNDSNNNTETSNHMHSSVEDTKTAVITSAIEDKGSRFYIKRRIIVGNVSKFIPSEKRDPTLKNYTHKWMIYVMEPKPDTKQESKPFLTAVRFHLHPSYKPYDIIDVTNEPFRLTRLGWGEFPIRLQLYFVDKKRNKSLDIIHHLKLDYTHSGKQTLGIERSIDIELDRNTNFDDITGIPSTNKECVELTKEQLQLNAVKQKITLLNSILKECLPEYPIISVNQSIKLPYTCARSSKLFLTWPIAKKKALEWHRSHLLRLRVQQRCRDTNDDILLTASDALTTKDVLRWCRNNGHTPLSENATEGKALSLISHPINYFCKFCGLNSHLTMQCSRKPEGWKKRSISLADQQTLSNVNILFEKLGWEPSLYRPTNHVYIKGEQIEGGDEEDMIYIDVEDRKMVNNSNLSTAKINQQMKEIFAFFKETTIESTLSLNDTKTLDWVWMIINQLQIKSILQNERSLSKMNDSLQKFSHYTVNTVPSTHIKQQLITGTILTQVFL
ncbi:unnamed protein product [Cunninghamella blakesleeana]